ncbi:hypothetical protein F2A07_09890 [Akkermansia sp. BIOML-A61]|jgi:hypothetical protein|nr:hypothetical protein F2A07_09890 [Akkermansia sp. BIOML-A61]
MKRLLLILLLFWTAVPADARVGMYFLSGPTQTAVEKESMSEWGEWMTFTPLTEKTKTLRELLGIMYDSLIGANMDLQEPLPEKMAVKNNLRIGEYYVFTLDGESVDLNSWLVMNKKGHIVHAFNFSYGSGKVLPRIDAVWIGMSGYGTPARDNMELHEQGDEMWIYYVDVQRGKRRLRSFVKGNVSVVTEDVAGGYYFDWPLEYDSPTIRQDELVPVLREFVRVQKGLSKGVEAEREILSVLPKAKKLKYDHMYRTIRYENPPPPPQALRNGMIPYFKKDRKPLMDKLGFPDASRYKITEASGPHPQRMTHCRLDWLKKFGVKNVVREYGAPASLVCRYLPDERTHKSMYIAVAQCGTREFALDSLAQMRLWKARLEEESRLKAQGDKEWDNPPEPDSEVVAARTNTSDKLVGEFALYLKGSLDKLGRVTEKGMYSSVFFVRGTTAVCVISEDPERNVLPLARRMDEELKKMYVLGPEKREPKMWEPDSGKEMNFNDYLKSKGVDPETGGPWKGGEDREPDSEEPE